MNQVTDLIWICALAFDQGARQLAETLGLSVIVENEKLTIYGGSSEFMGQKSTKFLLASSGYVKYFENTYLSQNLTEPKHAQLVENYFDEISSRYKTIAQNEINSACYDHLFNSALTTGSTFKNCLDFGCGPGSILDSSISREILKISGWDFSLRMRSLAASRGLIVLQPDEFEGASNEFDLIVSAYVLHYGTLSIEALRLLGQQMKTGGVLAANFHKSMGLSNFLAALNGVKELTLIQPITPSPFGPIVLLSRTDS